MKLDVRHFVSCFAIIVSLLTCLKTVLLLVEEGNETYKTSSDGCSVAETTLKLFAKTGVSVFLAYLWNDRKMFRLGAF